MNVRFVLGVLVAFVIGFACRTFAVPSPAPPALLGALLVVAMSVGYTAADRFLARRAATTAALCGGPTGSGGADRAAAAHRA